MKEYAFKSKNSTYDKFAATFYRKLLLCIMIFAFVLALCKFNPYVGEYVKGVLNNSYDVSTFEKYKDNIMNSAKKVYKNIESHIIWEE